MNLPFGTTFAKNDKGMCVFRIHYSADPAKGPDWVAENQPKYSSQAAWDQEQEISFSAYLGQLVYPEFKRQYTVVKPFPLPLDATHYMAIDPHPRVPHAFLWMCVDRFNNFLIHREFWPSKIYGKRGKLPEDDDLYRIDEYVKTVEWFESAEPDIFGPNGYSDNQGHAQKVYRRIMDPAGKAWSTERKMGKDEGETFWESYEHLGISCENARKDRQAGRDKVGTLLRPRQYMDGSVERTQSQILIFDTLPELILEMETYRYPKLKPSEIETKDPRETPVEQRCHLVDCLRYLCMADPSYIDPLRRNGGGGESEAVYDEIPSFKR